MDRGCLSPLSFASRQGIGQPRRGIEGEVKVTEGTDLFAPFKEPFTLRRQKGGPAPPRQSPSMVGSKRGGQWSSDQGRVPP